MVLAVVVVGVLVHVLNGFVVVVVSVVVVVVGALVVGVVGAVVAVVTVVAGVVVVAVVAGKAARPAPAATSMVNDDTTLVNRDACFAVGLRAGMVGVGTGAR